jgi:hypothetical protein
MSYINGSVTGWQGIGGGALPNTTNIAGPGSLGTVTNVASGTGLTGGPITTTGTLNLANTTVAAGSYTNANITVDAQGRLTTASSGTGGVNEYRTVFVNAAGATASGSAMVFEGVGVSSGSSIVWNNNAHASPNRFVVGATGLYMFACVYAGTTATNVYRVRINGADAPGNTAAGLTGVVAGLTFVYPMTAGQYAQMVATGASGQNVDGSTTGYYYSFTCIRLS